MKTFNHKGNFLLLIVLFLVLSSCTQTGKVIEDLSSTEELLRNSIPYSKAQKYITNFQETSEGKVDNGFFDYGKQKGDTLIRALAYKLNQSQAGDFFLN